MSIFPGSFPALPGVACDNFGGANAGADQFFLSHCHSGKVYYHKISVTH